MNHWITRKSSRGTYATVKAGQMKRLSLLTLILLLSLFPEESVITQTRPRQVMKTKEDAVSVGEDEVVRVDTALVTVPVIVMERGGKYVSDLKREDFRIIEDGVEQTVAYFAEVERPFTVVLMLDTSASTWSKLGKIRDAAAAFVKRLRQDDQVMVISFARGMTIKCQATKDRKKILEAIESTGRGLSTHLYDAVDKVMRKHLPQIRGRKAIVLFSDGVDATSNDATYESTVHLAEELDAIIYPILFDTYDPQNDQGSSPIPQRGSGLPSILRKIPLPLPIPTIGGVGSSSGGPGSTRADYERGEQYLRDLASRTGGHVYEAGKDLSLLSEAFGQIAEELGRQYSLGYYPKASGTVKELRRIKVLVKRQNLAVRARDSYVFYPHSNQSPIKNYSFNRIKMAQPYLPVAATAINFCKLNRGRDDRIDVQPKLQPLSKLI